LVVGTVNGTIAVIMPIAGASVLEQAAAPCRVLVWRRYPMLVVPEQVAFSYVGIGRSGNA
jgi:hypothetical protein